MNRLAIVEISDALLAHMLRYGTGMVEVTSNPLPADAKLVATSFDGRTVRLTYASDAFEPVAEGCQIPTFTPTFTRLEQRGA